MEPDPFERFKHNRFLTPISEDTLRKVGRHVGLSGDFLILDASCGKAGSVIALARTFGCSAIGLDPRPEFVEDGRRRVLLEDLAHRIDLLAHPEGALPFDDGYFDLALLCGPAHPSGAIDRLEDVARLVKPRGWIAYSDLAWRQDDESVPTERLTRWLDRHLPCEPLDAEDFWARCTEGGYEVAFAEREAQGAWEGFLAPQARAIIENRREYADSPAAQKVLDNWRRDLEIYHEGGGKQLLDYATFLLRRP